MKLATLNYSALAFSVAKNFVNNPDNKHLQNCVLCAHMSYFLPLTTHNIYFSNKLTKYLYNLILIFIDPNERQSYPFGETILIAPHFITRVKFY